MSRYYCKWGCLFFSCSPFRAYECCRDNFCTLCFIQLADLSGILAAWETVLTGAQGCLSHNNSLRLSAHTMYSIISNASLCNCNEWKKSLAVYYVVPLHCIYKHPVELVSISCLLTPSFLCIWYIFALSVFPIRMLFFFNLDINISHFIILKGINFPLDVRLSTPSLFIQQNAFEKP